MRILERKTNIWLAILTTLAIVMLWRVNSFGQDIDTLWYEDFESGWNGWYASNGVWDVGVPSSPGPDSAYSGDNCAGTILDGNYPTYTNTRLISPPFTVPSADENPRLRFWHWFLIHGSDHGVVEIKVEHPDSNWVEISDHFSQTGGPWTPYIIPLSAYEGESVRIAFHFISDHAYDNAGWYIDDVCLIIGDYVPNLADLTTESFEDGWRDWYASDGVWDVGVPSSPGPDSAYSGDNCAGTILDGYYTPYTNTRLISPPFTVPSADPQLEFWHWFLIHGSDHGVVEIKVEHPDSNWVEISDHFNQTGGPWTPYIIPLSPYEGESARIAFHFISDHAYADAGWYVDDILITIRTSVDNLYESDPSNFTLAGNYPNPFNASTTIKYILPITSKVAIDIYDILGRKVETVIQGEQPAGYHRITWDATAHSSGMYFYRIQAGEYAETRKMVLLK